MSKIHPTSRSFAVPVCAVLSILTASASRVDSPVTVRISTTLQSKDFSEKYRPEAAFTGRKGSMFVSERGPGPSDDFTVKFGQPITLTSIAVETGNDKQQLQLEQGVLEISKDGMAFVTAAPFRNGRATATYALTDVVAVRIQPTTKQANPLAIHKFSLQAKRRLGAPTREPRIVFISTDAPDLADWGVKAQAVASSSYPMILKALPSKGFIGPNYVKLWFNSEYTGVAATSGDNIEISPSYVRGHKNDLGMVVHELTHAIQHYTKDTDAGWLVEGIADYIRFYLYEPDVPRPRINPAKATYHDAYRTTAAFLAYAEDKYDHKLVNRLNDALRSGTYSDALFRQYTGKDPQAIWDEMIADLKAGKTKVARL